MPRSRSLRGRSPARAHSRSPVRRPGPAHRRSSNDPLSDALSSRRSRERSRSPRRRPAPAHQRASSTANGSSGGASSAGRVDGRDRDRDTEQPAVDYRAMYEARIAHDLLQKQKKRKRHEPVVSTQALGRGIRRVAVMFGEISAVITEAEEYALNPYPEDDPEEHQEDEGDQDEDSDEEGPRQPLELTEEQEQYLFDKRECERNLESFNVMKRIIPNLTKRLKDSDAEDLIHFYGAIQKGANDARSDDVRRLSNCIGNWLNDDRELPTLKRFDHTPPIQDEEGRLVRQSAPLFQPGSRSNRGIQHDIAGGLLSQIEHDWHRTKRVFALHLFALDVADESSRRIREELRSLAPGPDAAVINSSFYCRLFYADFDGDPEAVETGFLQSRYLGFKAVFTAPSSAEKDENTPPMKKLKTAAEKSTRRCVADILNMNGKVTGRSVAYVAILEHFSLTNATSWVNQYYGISYSQMYNFIVDYFEAPRAGTAAKQRADKLLEWWNKQIFPGHAASAATQRTAASSAAKLRAQRAAMEK
ncbi:hypothetical protein C8J57DRAFT_1728558 [Mycena rebaudengoi]|nr:hypothetical protein C8J57DRAFT_1728558 [Mycena rebaudengoi]